MQGNDLEAYIRQQLPGFELIAPPESLSGGLLNHVWRIPAKPYSLIAKFAPPYIASAPDIPMDSRRIHFEAMALKWWQQNNKPPPNEVRPPGFVHFDSEKSLLFMVDLGTSHDLAQALILAKPEEAQRMGRQLGAFLAHLHLSTFQDPFLAQSFQNHGVQQVRLSLQYHLLETLQNAEVPEAEKIANIVAQVGQQIFQPGLCLIMGDLWPPSVLLREDKMWIIDWEFSHFGWPVQDVAHMTAHLWMNIHMAESPDTQNRFRLCLESFLAQYREQTKHHFSQWESPDMYPIHMGAEIIARTLGTFQQGYLFEGLSPKDPRLQQAVDFAIRSILYPEQQSIF